METNIFLEWLRSDVLWSRELDSLSAINDRCEVTHFHNRDKQPVVLMKKIKDV